MHENTITTKIIRHMNSVPMCFARKRHGGKFGSGDPDIAGVIKGIAFYSEVKLVRTGELTKLQAVMLDKWAAAGAATSVMIYSEVQKRLFIVYRPTEGWLEYALIPVAKYYNTFSHYFELKPKPIQKWVDSIYNAGGGI